VLSRRALPATALERGVFTISLDFELIWGTRDLFGPERFGPACEIERELVVDRLLDLFAEFEMPATWCTVGHLFLAACERQDGRKHPEIQPPSHPWHPDWFQHDPCTVEAQDPNFYGASLIARIRACPVPQEIGCHTFSHAIFGDAGCSRATAESEIRECLRLAAAQGIELRSMAFPRNAVGHLDVLREAGFTCYRGPEPHEEARLPSALKRLVHLLAVLTARRPPVISPDLTPSGLRNVAASMMYFPMHGARRHIPIALRVRRAERGLDAAARSRRVFHLWFHPTNLADEPEAMFAGLRRILEHASSLRERAQLDFLPMAAVAASADGTTGPSAGSAAR
jgi:peptidoglycan/xylan/chitin deacetylase (PgdA/CDA1 family)